MQPGRFRCSCKLSRLELVIGVAVMLRSWRWRERRGDIQDPADIVLALDDAFSQCPVSRAKQDETIPSFRVNYG